MKSEVVEPPTPERAEQTGAVNPHAPACECSEADRRMLEGPHSRTRELFTLLGVMWDFVCAFRVLPRLWLLRYGTLHLRADLNVL